MQKPTEDITFTSVNGVDVTLLRNPHGKWSADIGRVTIGPLAWSALVANVEFNLNATNRRTTLAMAGG